MYRKVATLKEKKIHIKMELVKNWGLINISYGPSPVWRHRLASFPPSLYIAT